MRNDKLIRVLSIIRELDRNYGQDIYELSEKFGVNTRTIKRDLEAIEYAGLPIIGEYFDESKKKKYRIDFKDSLEKVSGLIDHSHYTALTMLMKGADNLKSSSAFSALDDLSEKLEGSLGRRSRDQLLKIQQAFHSYNKHFYHEEAPDFFWALVDAIVDQRVCEITYYSHASKKDKVYEMLPLKIFRYKESLYLFAEDRSVKKVKTLNMNRMKGLKTTELKSKAPVDFDPDKYELNSFGIFSGEELEEFELLFEAELALIIEERTWHPSQILTKYEDGTVRLEFSCAYSPELFTWIAGWHDKVKVIRPLHIVEKLTKGYGSLLKKYGA